MLFLIFISVNIKTVRSQSTKDSYTTVAISPLQEIEITANTGEKPQSKIWFHDDIWWAILPNTTGTILWKLVDTKWVNVLHLSDSTNTRADVRAIGNVTQILLYEGINSQLVSVEYDKKNKRYQLWSLRPYSVNIPLEKKGETATIDIDSNGRMWLASDDETEIHVRWSDSPYVEWSKPITIATGISADDICAISSFPNGSVGVLWSNQIIKRFGFRLHINNTSPENWGVDEIPASNSAIPWKDGMADDHLNIAIASDGTLYAAVKTSYDTEKYPLIALLIRYPTGKWDKLYNVDDEGSRGIILLNEKKDSILFVYSSYKDHKIVYKKSSLELISFGKRHTLINSTNKINRINNATSTKQNFNNEIVIMVSEKCMAKSVLLKYLN